MRITITDTNAQYENVCSYAGAETALNPTASNELTPGLAVRIWASFAHCR